MGEDREKTNEQVRSPRLLMYTTNFALFCRLRFEEVVRLEIEDIDSNRKLIYLKGTKGKKDRYKICRIWL